MFFLQDPSLLEFQRRFQNSIQRNNLSTVFGVGDIPGDSQLRDVIDEHSYEPLYGVFEEYFKGLQRGKHLEEYWFLGKYYLVSVDGTEYFGSEKIGCMKCLRKKSKDCELQAGKRLIPKLRAAHRQLPMMIVGDSLYSKQPFIRLVKKQRMCFILVAKPKDHKTLMEDIEGLRRGVSTAC